jgi:hypothetical protein
MKQKWSGIRAFKQGQFANDLRCTYSEQSKRNISSLHLHRGNLSLQKIDTFALASIVSFLALAPTPKFQLTGYYWVLAKASEDRDQLPDRAQANRSERQDASGTGEAPVQNPHKPCWHAREFDDVSDRG